MPAFAKLDPKFHWADGSVGSAYVMEVGRQVREAEPVREPVVLSVSKEAMAVPLKDLVPFELKVGGKWYQVTAMKEGRSA